MIPIARLVAVGFALVAFAVAIVAGLSAGNPAEAILLRAVMCLLGAWIAGFAIGLVLEHVVRIETRKIDATAETVLASESEPPPNLLRD